MSQRTGPDRSTQRADRKRRRIQAMILPSRGSVYASHLSLDGIRAALQRPQQVDTLTSMT